MTLRTCKICSFKSDDFPVAYIKNNKKYYRGHCKPCEKIRKDKWRSSNKEKHNLKGKEWYLNNLDKARNIRKKWRDNNKEFYRQYRKTAYKDKVNAQTSLRRKRVKLNTPSWITKEQKKQIRTIYLECIQLNKGTNQYHVDHIIPLKGQNVSGLHVPWNLQIIPAKDNIKKRNQHVN